jgi:ketosteroid isomerase-like protein
MAELLTEDIVWIDPALPEPARGVPAVQEFMRMNFLTFPDLRFGEPDPPHLTATGEQVAWAWTMEGTMGGSGEPGSAATGPTVKIEGVDLWSMRDGRIAHYRAFYDMADLVRQLGVAPPSDALAQS